MPHIYKTEKKNSLNTDSPLFIGTDNICTQIRSTLGFAGEGGGGDSLSLGCFVDSRKVIPACRCRRIRALSLSLSLSSLTLKPAQGHSHVHIQTKTQTPRKQKS